MIYRFASFEVDDSTFRLSQDGVPIILEPKALRLLLFLVANPGRLIRKQELLDSVWADAAVTENALTRSVALLRKALNDDSREPRFIETAPRAGYRFLAEVTIAEPQRSGSHSLPDPATAPTQVMAWPHSHLTLARPAFGLLAVFTVGLAALGGWRIVMAARSKHPIRSIAVLPLENLSGDPSLDYFADGTTAELTTELARIPNLRVVSRSSAMLEKGTHKPLAQVASELHVDAVVEGSVVLSGARVRINAALVEPREDRQLWSSSVEGSTSDMVPLEDGVAQQMASHARLELAPSSTHTAIAATSIDPAAHDAYLRGLYFYDKRDPVRSAAYFKQAIDLEPTYSSAYAAFSEALVSQAFLGKAKPEDIMPKATAAAAKAIESNSENGQAYIARGVVEATLSWDWAGADRDLRQGLQLNPGDSVGQMMFSLYLYSTNRPQDALLHMRLARDIDPLSFYMSRQYATALFYARRYDDALQQLQQAKEMQGGSPNVVDNWISWAYEKKEMYDQAVEYDLRAAHDQADAGAALRNAYARGGWKEYWRKRSESLHPDTGYACSYYQLGLAYARIDESTKAFEALSQAADHRCFWMSEVQADPLLDSLRADPRFRDLLHRVNF